MCEVVDFNVCVVIPASGTGERMGVSLPKQYCQVLNKPLITYTLNTFNRIKFVECIIVTGASEFIPLLEEIIADNGFTKALVVEGATTRHRSIFNGIKAIPRVCSDPCVVLIHDGVRVFADEDTVRNVAIAAHKHGAAGIIRPLISTVIAADSDNFLEESLDRAKYRASEMPQAFRYEVIKSAYEKITDYDFDYGTECLHLAMKYTGTKAHLLNGPSNLWKVTYKKDLHGLAGMLKEKFLTVVIDGNADNSLREALKKRIEERGITLLSKCEMKTDIHSITGIVVFHSKFCMQSFEQKTSELIASIKSARNTTPVIITDIVVVHVINSTFNYLNHCDIQKTVEASAKKKKDIYTFCILYKPSANNEDHLARMIVSLLWEMNAVFSGQVFCISD